MSRRDYRNSPVLRLETLEKKELMTADILLQGGTLTIDGDNGQNTAEVNYVSGNQIEVKVSSTLTHGFSLVPFQSKKSFNRSAVKRITFDGRGNDDSFVNNTRVPSKAYGGSGNDYLEGGNGRDEFFGGSGRDTLKGYGGSDYLSGGSGNDTLYGHSGNDTVRGNSGNDYLSGGSGNDKVYGHAGNDTVRGNWGNDYLSGGSGNDGVFGEDGNDTVRGNDGDDYLSGGSGNDVLQGHSGKDWLYGGWGNDSLHGGGRTSADQLWGGSGRDRFLTQKNDVIHDGNGLHRRDGEDAQVRFIDRGKNWSDKEIAVVDEAFHDLFQARNSNVLLKDTRTGTPLSFYQDDLPNPGLNTVYTYQKGCWTTGPWYNRTEHCDFRTRFHHREISIDEWNESNASANGDVVDTVLHEIGHNFDGGQAQVQIWNQFLRVSGWVRNPRSKAGLQVGRNMSGGGGDNHGWYRNTNNVNDFARGYGGTNPYEDWATAWEQYFANGRSTAASNAQLARKLRLVDQMVRAA